MPDEKKKGLLMHIGSVNQEEKNEGFLMRYFKRFFNKQALDPLVRSFLTDALVGGVNRMINGTNNSPYGSAFQNLARNYNQMFQNNLFAQQPQLQAPVQKPTNTYSWNVVLLPSRAKATAMIEDINRVIATGNKVKVSDVNMAVDRPDRDYTDNEYGWAVPFTLADCQTILNEDGTCILVLPKPMVIKN